ncbi:MAG TPA: helix-turn-helix transcriptional regulator [Bauldia sp.]|nr:helix-turn-helix transcriptional regulator [Bauldia sp.]
MREFSDAELKFEIEYQRELLRTAFYGAFLTAVEARRDEDGLTQAALARLTGKDKTAVSKLLSEPKNWTLRTVSDLCVALDVSLLFCLLDNASETRVFSGTGIEHLTLRQVPYGNFVPAAGGGGGSTAIYSSSISGTGTSVSVASGPLAAVAINGSTVTLGQIEPSNIPNQATTGGAG